MISFLWFSRLLCDMTKNSVSASAPGNVFIFGESPVIYRASRPLSPSVDRRTRVTLKERSDKQSYCRVSVFGKARAILEKRLWQLWKQGPELYPLLDFLSEMTGKLNISSGFDWKSTQKSLWIQAMSSSTAVFCSVLRALSEMSQKKIDTKTTLAGYTRNQVKIHGGKGIWQAKYLIIHRRI